MTKDKKQILVVGVLFAVILAVGAFQFMGGSKGKPTGKTEDNKKKDDPVLAVKGDVKDPIGDITNQLFTNALVPRDPFVPQAVIIDETPPDQGQHPTVIQHPGGIEGPIEGPVKPFPVEGPDGKTGLEPTEPPKDAWALRGVMSGKRGTLAMIEDHKGQQFLVKEGDVLNENTTVLSISKTGVELMTNGKPIHLALLGGN